MRKVHWFGKTVSERDEYARKEEFVRVFECERIGLQMLALLVTANSEAVKRCLIRAFRECVASSSVAKESASLWAPEVSLSSARMNDAENDKRLRNCARTVKARRQAFLLAPSFNAPA